MIPIDDGMIEFRIRKTYVRGSINDAAQIRSVIMAILDAETVKLHEAELAAREKEGKKE